MTRIGMLNLALAAALAGSLALNWYVRRPSLHPNMDFAQAMARDPAFGSFNPNPNFADRATQRTAVPGTIPRGLPPLGFGPSVVEGIRAGNELENPFSAEDADVLERGRVVYARYCELCHAEDGRGAGRLTRHGFPAPTLLRTATRQMKDGQVFHIVTFGRGAMPPHRGQISVEDRWKVVLHVRALQHRQAAAGE